MTMKTYLIDITVESGEIYGLHFECDGFETAEALAELIRKGVKVEVAGELVLGLDIEDVDNNSV